MFVFTPEDLIKILLALLIGGVIGFEREMHSKAAGLRTITLICVGSTLFMIISMKMGDDRIAANIVSGVGFLGAGVILFAEGRLKGLTTAASIWTAAALGMTIGKGEYVLAITVTAVVMVVLVFLANVDRLLDSAGRETRTYDIVYDESTTKRKKLEEMMGEVGLKIRSHKPMKKEGKMVSIWELEGHAKEHARFCEKLMDDPDIKEIKY
jgi:putative Mg2+ transporter-C (MgtC) family protein